MASLAYVSAGEVSIGCANGRRAVAAHKEPNYYACITIRRSMSHQPASQHCLLVLFGFTAVSFFTNEFVDGHLILSNSDRCESTTIASCICVIYVRVCFV